MIFSQKSILINGNLGSIIISIPKEQKEKKMRFQYCPTCGSRLTERKIGDEGMVPYCEACGRPLFDMFACCIIALVMNEREEAALLRQNYISQQYHNLVSGYMKPGERAEETAKREIYEEIGIRVDSLKPAGTYWFEKKDMLMIGFIGRCRKKEMTLSEEVDEAKWIPVEEAISLVHPEGSISYSLLEGYLKETDGEKRKRTFCAGDGPFLNML